MRISVLKEEVQDAKYFPYQFFFSPPTQLSRRNNTVREFKKKKKKPFKGLCLFSEVHKGKK